MRRILLATVAIIVASPAFAADKPLPAVPPLSDKPAIKAADKPAVAASDKAAEKTAGKTADKKDADAMEPAPAAAKSQGLALTMDEVRTLTFKNPVATVYVGNPSIADITMIDARHAFVLGKAYGRTNIVALNHDGVQVYNGRIDVAETGNETLVLNRGAQRVTYNCANNRCDVAPTPGDGKDAFDAITNQLATHVEAARKSAGAN